MPMTLFVFFCGTNMSKMPMRKVYHDVMRGLLDLVFPPRETELLVRSIRPEALASLVNPVTNEAGVVALLPYREPLVHALIIETKYHGNTAASSLLASVLSDYLLERMSEETELERRNIALIPLPLSGKRKRERGYNQVEQVLQEAATQLGAHMETNLLTRTRHTTPQTRLSKEERRTNVTDAFRTTTPDPAYLYIVVDDVLTTGATLAEAVHTLTKAGADRVIAVALAH